MGKTFKGKYRDYNVKKAQQREADMREKTYSSDKDYKRKTKHKNKQSYED